MSLMELVTTKARRERHDDEAVEHRMVVLNVEGHTTVTWNPEDEASVNAARAEFDRLCGEGYQAFEMDVITENGVVVEEKGKRVRSFTPAVGKLMMVPQLHGG